MKCVICETEYFYGSSDPPQPNEPCWCGEDANGSPYTWGGWQGITSWLRFKLFYGLQAIAEWVLPESCK